MTFETKSSKADRGTSLMYHSGPQTYYYSIAEDCVWLPIIQLPYCKSLNLIKSANIEQNSYYEMAAENRFSLKEFLRYFRPVSVIIRWKTAISAIPRNTRKQWALLFECKLHAAVVGELKKKTLWFQMMFINNSFYRASLDVLLFKEEGGGGKHKKEEFQHIMVSQ